MPTKPVRGQQAKKNKATTGENGKAKPKSKQRKVAGAGAFFGADSKSKGKKSTLSKKTRKA